MSAVLEAEDCVVFQGRPTTRDEPHILLMTSREAATALAVSERTLWTLTNRGEIPAVRIGRSVRYDPHDLTRWISQLKGTTN